MTGPGILLIGLGFLGAYYEALGVRFVGAILSAAVMLIALVAAKQAFEAGDWFGVFAYPVRVGIGIFIGTLIGGALEFATGPYVNWRDSGTMKGFTLCLGIGAWAVSEFYIHDSVEHMVCWWLGFIDVSRPGCGEM